MSSPRRDKETRFREVERIFNDMGWEGLTQLEEWDGEALDELRKFLTEEQYQTLLDELQEPDVRTR